LNLVLRDEVWIEIGMGGKYGMGHNYTLYVLQRYLGLCMGNP